MHAMYNSATFLNVMNISTTA